VSEPRWRIRLTLVDGTTVLWRRAGVVHTLSETLGPVWAANFKPALFQALPDGEIVPRGGSPRAIDIAAVAVEPVT
jgi:hypothetical protein